MRQIDRGARFKRDFKRAMKGKYRDVIDKGGEFDQVMAALQNDIPLPSKYKDHPLHNNLEGFRECHLRPDFLLVYAYVGDDFLRLEMLGSHSEIFGL